MYTNKKEPPEILEPLRPISVKEEETVVLSAQVVGQPTPKVTWLKNDKPVKLKPKRDNSLTTLTIVQSKVSDSGEYAVIATNDLGKAETRAYLTVEGIQFVYNKDFINAWFETFLL